MALKRIFELNSRKARACLRCGWTFEPAQLKNDTIATCASCGQKHFVDLLGGGMCILTVFERPDLRRKETKADPVPELEPVQQEKKQPKEPAGKRRSAAGTPERTEVEELKRQLKEALKRAEMAEQNAKEWEKAADDLARMIEIYMEERRQLRAILEISAGSNPAKI